MTRNDTMQVLNDSDDMERRLNYSIFTQENEWPYLEGYWNPGDPIHNYPNPGLGEQYARRMVEVLENDVELYSYMVDCKPCGVGWNPFGAQTTKCWVCGEIPAKMQDIDLTKKTGHRWGVDSMRFSISAFPGVEMVYTSNEPSSDTPPLEYPFSASAHPAALSYWDRMADLTVEMRRNYQHMARAVTGSADAMQAYIDRLGDRILFDPEYPEPRFQGARPSRVITDEMSVFTDYDIDYNANYVNYAAADVEWATAMVEREFVRQATERFPEAYGPLNWAEHIAEWTARYEEPATVEVGGLVFPAHIDTEPVIQRPSFSYGRPLEELTSEFSATPYPIEIRRRNR